MPAITNFKDYEATFETVQKRFASSNSKDKADALVEWMDVRTFEEAHERHAALYWLKAQAKDKSFTTALKALEIRATTKDDARAKVAMGYVLLKGIGTTADNKKAFDLFSDAAALNHPEGQFYWAFCTMEGKGTTPDVVLGIERYTTAKDNGSLAAAYNLGRYFVSEGEHQDRDRALKLFEESAAKGFSRSYFSIAHHTERTPSSNAAASTIFHHYKQGAQLNNPQCKAALALCHLEGRGTEVNPEMALRLTTESIRDGFIQAGRHLVPIHKQLASFNKDRSLPAAEDALLEEGVTHLVKAVHAGRPTAVIAIVSCAQYYQSLGKKPQASDLYTIAANFYHHGVKTAQHSESANHYYNLAYQLGNAQSAFMLAEHYTSDDAKQFTLLQDSARGNYEPAIKKLADNAKRFFPIAAQHIAAEIAHDSSNKEIGEIVEKEIKSYTSSFLRTNKLECIASSVEQADNLTEMLRSKLANFTDNNIQEAAKSSTKKIVAAFVRGNEPPRKTSTSSLYTPLLDKNSEGFHSVNPGMGGR
jgi:TPR repeat protein